MYSIQAHEPTQAPPPRTALRGEWAVELHFCGHWARGTQSAASCPTGTSRHALHSGRSYAAPHGAVRTRGRDEGTAVGRCGRRSWRRGGRLPRVVFSRRAQMRTWRVKSDLAPDSVQMPGRPGLRQYGQMMAATSALGVALGDVQPHLLSTITACAEAPARVGFGMKMQWPDIGRVHAAKTGSWRTVAVQEGPEGQGNSPIKGSWVRPLI